MKQWIERKKQKQENANLLHNVNMEKNKPKQQAREKLWCRCQINRGFSALLQNYVVDADGDMKMATILFFCQNN